VVGGAIAFDGQDVAARLGRVLNGEVDPVAGGPVLGGQFQPVPQEGVTDVDLERVQRRLIENMISEVGALGLGVLQVLAQQLDAFGGGALGVHVAGGETRTRA
jgi:hypothetical protein